jgi:glycolate oxidase iron-sulfur subunit
LKPNLSDLTAQCIKCGFCLESCPTFLETGSEVHSPRGRIYLAKSAEEGAISWAADAAPALDTCLGCRACETACPSGVKYGEILELAKGKTATARPKRVTEAMVTALSNPGLARLQTSLGAMLPGDRIPSILSWALSGQEPEAAPPIPQRDAPFPSLDPRRLPAVRGHVALLEGCVMRSLFPRVHQATRRLLRRVGLEVLPLDLGCCGALQAHSGLLGQAEEKVQALARKLPADVRLVVNSAGCGSTIKSCGHVIGQGLEHLAERTFDVTEILLSEGLEDLLVSSPGVKARAVYHDACHLAHGQGIRTQPRRLIGAIPGLELAPLKESELCCGSAGTFNLTQPALARKLLDRKMANVLATGASLLVSGNPGCHAWMAQGAKEAGGGITSLHTVELLEASFIGWPLPE